MAWRDPVVLGAGEAVCIPLGWWHSVASEANGVALTVEARRSSFKEPQFFGAKAPTKVEPRTGRHISRRAGWHNSASILHAFREALQHNCVD